MTTTCSARARWAVFALFAVCTPAFAAPSPALESPRRIAVGTDTLAVTLYPPHAQTRAPLVILMPGSERFSRAIYAPIARRFAAAGVAALTWDRRGEGGSGGVWDSTQSIQRIAEDARALLDAASRWPEVDAGRILVWGLSQGGWSGTRLAAIEPRVRAAILISDPALPTDEERLNERWWRLVETGYTREEAEQITAVRRVLWGYYRSGIEPEGFADLWRRTLAQPWFARLQWPRWQPSPDSLAPAVLAGFRDPGYDPVPDMRATTIPVLRLYGSDDHHLRSDRSLIAARAAYRGLAPDTTFRWYPGRGHGLQSTAERAECVTCGGHAQALVHGIELDDRVWADVWAWLEPRLRSVTARP